MNISVNAATRAVAALSVAVVLLLLFSRSVAAHGILMASFFVVFGSMAILSVVAIFI